MIAYLLPKHWKRSLLFWSLILFFLLGSCSSLPSIRRQDISLDGFPSLAVEEGTDIDPASDPFAIADVDILALSDRMKRILDEYVIHIKNPNQRLEALLDVVYSNGVFNLTDDGHRTKTASETFDSGAGNCLSFSSAFVAMARYVNLDARFQDVPTYPNWDKEGNLLFFNKHISVMVETDRRTRYEVDFDPRGNLPYRKKDKESVEIPDNRALAQYYNNVGSEFLAAGSPTNAFRYFIKALKTDPALSYVWSNLGSVYNQNHQVEAAERAYRQAIAISHSEYTAMSNLARLYSKQGKTEQAEFYRQRVKSFRNRNPYYHYAISEKAFDEGQYAQTVKHLKNAIRRKEDEHRFHFAMARAYLKLGAMKKAEKSLENARVYSPDETTLRYYSRMWKALAGELNGESTSRSSAAEQGG